MHNNTQLNNEHNIIYKFQKYVRVIKKNINTI